MGGTVYTIRSLMFSLFLFMAVMPVAAYAQKMEAVPLSGTFRVQWVGEISDSAYVRKSNLLERFTNTVFGKQETNRLMRPFAVYPVDTQEVFILDQQACTIFRVHDKQVQVPKAFKAEHTAYSSLIGLCRIPGDTLLFTDSHLKTICYLSPDLKTQGVWRTEPTLNQPTGIARDPKNNRVWVCETASHQIRILDVLGKTDRIIGKRGNGRGEFNFPTSIWIDRYGKAYVVDAMNFRIQLFDAAGNFLSSFGEAGDGSGYLARPKGIAVDSYGHIYVSDALFHAVQVFDASGQFLYQFGNQGRAKGEFWMPAGIYIDAEDTIYVADSFNARIQLFKLVKDP